MSVIKPSVLKELEAAARMTFWNHVTPDGQSHVQFDWDVDEPGQRIWVRGIVRYPFKPDKPKFTLGFQIPFGAFNDAVVGLDEFLTFKRRVLRTVKDVAEAVQTRHSELYTAEAAPTKGVREISLRFHKKYLAERRRVARLRRAMKEKDRALENMRKALRREERKTEEKIHELAGNIVRGIDFVPSQLRLSKPSAMAILEIARRDNPKTLGAPMFEEMQRIQDILSGAVAGTDHGVIWP